MPNFDAGTYFLTTLAPITNGPAAGETGGVSCRQRLAMTLATLPTALQSPATERIGVQSPFARNRRTHLCRFAILDDAIYNGRDRQNAIVTSIRDGDPAQVEAPDQLNGAYLLFAAEIDAVTEDGAPLPANLGEAEQDRVRDAYARTLWETMEPEARAIWSHCVGFDQVSDAAGFARYLERCQIETTMPFHDYWTRPPKLDALPFKALAVAIVLPAAAFLLGLVGWLLGLERAPLLALLVDWPAGATAVWGLVLTAAALFGAYRLILARGARPLPPPNGAHLPGVLKALYLQQRFAEFIVERQDAAPEALHAAFGDFIAAHRPEADSEPTQPPGVVRWPPAPVSRARGVAEAAEV